MSEDYKEFTSIQLYAKIAKWFAKNQGAIALITRPAVDLSSHLQAFAQPEVYRKQLAGYMPASPDQVQQYLFVYFDFAAKESRTFETWLTRTTLDAMEDETLASSLTRNLEDGADIDEYCTLIKNHTIQLVCLFDHLTEAKQEIADLIPFFKKMLANDIRLLTVSTEDFQPLYQPLAVTPYTIGIEKIQPPQNPAIVQQTKEIARKPQTKNTPDKPPTQKPRSDAAPPQNAPPDPIAKSTPSSSNRRPFKIIGAAVVVLLIAWYASNNTTTNALATFHLYQQGKDQLLLFDQSSLALQIDKDEEVWLKFAATGPCYIYAFQAAMDKPLTSLTQHITAMPIYLAEGQRDSMRFARKSIEDNFVVFTSASRDRALEELYQRYLQEGERVDFSLNTLRRLPQHKILTLSLEADH